MFKLFEKYKIIYFMTVSDDGNEIQINLVETI